MSYILFIAAAAAAAFKPALKWNDKRNSMYLPIAAWPMAPLVVP